VDIVNLQMPLYPSTEDTARSKLVERDAVVRALESDQLAGYAGDVWFPQPASKDHPWRTMPFNGMTPHISGTSLSAQARYAAGTLEILESYFGGIPIPWRVRGGLRGGRAPGSYEGV
jgi:formate dehydrogenase